MKRFTNTRKSTRIGLLGGVIVLVAPALISHQHLLALLSLPDLLMALARISHRRSLRG